MGRIKTILQAISGELDGVISENLGYQGQISIMDGYIADLTEEISQLRSRESSCVDQESIDEVHKASVEAQMERDDLARELKDAKSEMTAKIQELEFKVGQLETAKKAIERKSAKKQGVIDKISLILGEELDR